MTKNNTKQFDVNDGQTYKLWNECECGCGQVVRNRFAQGHDMKVKTQAEKGR